MGTENVAMLIAQMNPQSSSTSWISAPCSWPSVFLTSPNHWCIVNECGTLKQISCDAQKGVLRRWSLWPQPAALWDPRRQNVQSPSITSEQAQLEMSIWMGHHLTTSANLYLLRCIGPLELSQRNSSQVMTQDSQDPWSEQHHSGVLWYLTAYP